MNILLTKQSITGGQLYQDRAYVIEGGIIRQVESGVCPAQKLTSYEVIDLRHLTVLPGLIDIHIHGGNGFDTMDGSYESINAISQYKLAEGVTSFCPTTVTASLPKTYAAIDSVRTAIEKGTDGAKVLGIFLEGPYINPKYKGAHPEEFIRSIDVGEMIDLTERAKPGLVSIAIAPELPEAIKAIKTLTAKGVHCRIGHSAATMLETTTGQAAGANVVIHAYNAMSPLHHREPGMVGAMLTLQDLYAEIICDFQHVNIGAVRILQQCKAPERIILITDCLAPGGLKDGEYRLGELPIYMKDGICRIAEGNLAGSTATLISCVKNMYQHLGVSLVDAVTMATTAPAKALGLYPSIGSLEEGAVADIVAIDEDFNIQFVMINGKVLAF